MRKMHHKNIQKKKGKLENIFSTHKTAKDQFPSCAIKFRNQ